MEYSTFIELPEDRCGFSDRGHTCVSEAWHGGFHRMVPSSWIRHKQFGSGPPARRDDIDALMSVAEVEEHQHSWGPFGCWCGATQPQAVRNHGLWSHSTGARV